MKGFDMNVRDVLSFSPVLPVMMVHDVDNTIKAAQAMFEGGIRAFEITLRTPIALQAIRELRHSLPAAAIIGAGTITCNYDGVNKFKTIIGKDVRVGSGTMLVAPLSVGDKATTGAGSVITSNCPAGKLTVGRARQFTAESWIRPEKTD